MKARYNTRGQTCRIECVTGSGELVNCFGMKRQVVVFIVSIVFVRDVAESVALN